MNRAALLIFLAFAMPAVSTDSSKALSQGTESKLSEKSKKAPSKNHPIDFTLKTLGGTLVRLSDYPGKVVLVNIWAPWCGPCRAETPGFVSLYEKYKQKGFEVIGVAVNTNESEVRSFISKYGIRWPVGIGEAIAAQFGTTAIPDNYLFGLDAKIVKHWIGLTTEEELQLAIEQALNEPSRKSIEHK